MARPRNENSERAIAENLTAATGLNIGISTVRRLKAKGVNLQDHEAVMHAFAMAERKPSRTNAQPSPPKAPIRPADPARPMSSSELDERLAELERELLNAPDYETGRSVKIKISGFRELVRVQKERGFLIDRNIVEAEGYEAGLLFRYAAMRFPAELLPRIIGLDYPDAVDVCEEWIHQLLTDLHELTEKHLVTILKEMGATDAANRRKKLTAQRNETA